MRTDDFSLATKKELAQRAGYKCCFLGCGHPTFGPSEESSESSVSSGMACHISAASSGKSARRYLASMTSDERKNINNGIWMCYKHGKIIDADEKRFSIEVLKDWKKVGEKVAQIMVERGIEYKEALKALEFTDLISDNVLIGKSVGGENQIIGDALNDCGVGVIWGEEIVHIIRDFLIEHTRNAFQHGNATDISLDIKDNKLILTDNGSKFNPKTLYNSELSSGGAISVLQLLNKLDSNFIVFSERREEKNIVTIANLRNQDEVLKMTPCSYKMSFKDFREGSINLQISETCDEIFIILPTYISPSDIGLIGRRLLNLETETRQVTFITKELTEWVIKMIKDNHPGCQVVEVK